MAKSNDLILKPVGELLDKSFFIPAYQRGYRWTKRQVTNLLDDIKEFQQQSDEGPKAAFYCLQPIVVKAKNGEWELVDGQQRLTTINIILVYLKEIADILGKSSFKMRYETRPNSAEFLNEINKERSGENIDFYHMSKALEAIEEWFEKQDSTYKIRFLQTLLNDDETGKNVKVIWYQINEEIDATVVFSRLNIGKIPLTNAELVKALFLRSSNFDLNNQKALHLEQLKIAQEWDSIEKLLQDNEFWYFVSNDATESNRIEFILLLAAREFADQEVALIDPLFIFLAFNKRLEGASCLPENEWLSVKRYFMTLHEWFTDHELFHLVGFLVSQNVSIADLMLLSRKFHTRLEFRSALINRVFKEVFPNLLSPGAAIEHSQFRASVFEELEQLTYDVGRNRLLPILLLFNIASLIANPKTNARFQFNRFKLEEWDIEHIRSVSSQMPVSKEKQKLWLENVIQYISETSENNNANEVSKESLIEGQIIREDAKRLLTERTFSSNGFEIVFERVISLYDPNGNEEIDQTIGNLTLLDSSTNRSYQNAIFPIKRARIIALDKSATFVPLCTKNAFLKYYSKQIDKMMFWESKDSQAHQQAMVDALVNFFTNQEVVK